MNRRRLVISLAAAAFVYRASPAMAKEARSGDCRLRFTMTFTNASGRELRDQAFWSYLPATIDGEQRLVSTDASCEHQVDKDPLGHQIFHLAFDRFPAFAHKVVSVTTMVSFDAAGRSRSTVKPGEWLDAERYIESADPAIVQLAATLRREDDTETGKAIYEWVRGHVVYAGYVADDLGARYALEHLSGDCTEYADLVVALARASGIPARMIGGFVVSGDSAPRPEEYHNWAELWLSGAWRVVDAQKESWLDSRGYVAFRIYRDVATNAIDTANRYRVQGDMTVAF